jgi:hypothetical protein
MGVGRLVLEFTSGKSVVISHGKDDPTAICDVLA